MNSKANIVILKSKEKNNFFAPEWQYFLYEDFINNVDFKKIAKLILLKEKNILKKFPSGKKGDGYTGLGKKSLTSRFEKFNVLKFKEKEIQKLKEQIVLCHNNFLEKLNLKPYPHLYIQCWANVMRKGEQIKPHIHGTNEDTYLGGHICVQCKNTNTNYINPVNQINEPEIYKSKNLTGKISLFQNCIPHYTDMHNGKEERITIAFDLHVNENVLKENKNLLQLY
jgi:hypothetical protein